LNIFITFSDLPLKLVSYSSFIFLIFSIFYSLLILYRKLVLSVVIPGYSSTIILLSMGFGLVLFALGVIGEYIHRINQKTTKRPNFIINKII
jgi:undecaprenyl-phosphate 4-deoxy-4-formamido-L-arabinose transferase